MKRSKILFLLMTSMIFALIFASAFAGKSTTDSSAKVKKKIVFVKDDDGEFFKAVTDLMGDLLAKKGWTKDTSEYIVLSLEGKESKAPEIVSQIIEMKPDVILMNTTLIKPIAMNLKEAGIACVAGGGLELEDDNGKLIFVDKNGSPTTNLTGTYTMPRTQLENSLKFLNKVSPIKNKKIVFATFRSAAFTKPKVEKACSNLKIDLKEFREFDNMEDYQDFVQKYNNDKEVGWIISGEHISRHKDGSACTFEEYYKWERENNKKPNIGFWEDGVQGGKLCALAIDSMTTVNQMIDMTDRVLKGEKVSKIKPEDPKKTLVILNQARAKDIGIVFPIDVVKSAWKIYTDYNKNFEGKK